MAKLGALDDRTLLAKTSLSGSVAKQALSLFKKLNTGLDGIVAGLTAPEHAFGATLFSNANVEPFSISPVTFEPR